MKKAQQLSPADLEYLESVVGAQWISRGTSTRELHSHDESFHTPCFPDVVIWPQSTDDVSSIVRFAAGKSIPVTAWGAGSSLEGNPIPVEGGIVLDLQEMNRVLAIRHEDFQVDVQAGVIYKELNEELRHYGLFFPPRSRRRRDRRRNDRQ